MDAVSRAISKGLHISKIEKLNSQSWEEFEQKVENKKLFIFGTGVCAGFFWDKYEAMLPLTGIIDNSKEKQGKLVEEVIGASFLTNNMRVSDISVLDFYHPDEVVVLITSTNYYEEIAKELDNKGISNYYVLLTMESKCRNGNLEEYQSKTWDERRDAYVRACCRLPIKKNKILFSGFGTISDHGKYISEQLVKLRGDLDVVWMVDDTNIKIPDKVRLVKRGDWKSYLYEIHTAKMWIFNVEFPDCIMKRPEQIFIQTKHWASVTLKKFYLDSSMITDIPESVALWKYNAKCLDYIITGSDFDTESCRRGFDFHEEVIQVGSPRSDAMFHEKEMKEKVCEYYQVDNSCHFLLYAPTYRYKKGVDKHIQETRNIDLDYAYLKKTLEQCFGGQWYILLRLHPGQEKDIESIERPDYVLDGSNYADGMELASASDIMITDYSSIMFEPAFVKKPVFLFATDREEYIDKEYDFLIDYDSLPFSIAENNDELMNNICQFNREEYEEAVETFLEKYGVHEDGHASERAAEFISKLIE